MAECCSECWFPADSVEKTCCWRRKKCADLTASAFLVRLFAFAAVQERSWLFCGGFGRWLRGGIRRLRRMGRAAQSARVFLLREVLRQRTH
jgi:hypothetical protein